MELFDEFIEKANEAPEEVPETTEEIDNSDVQLDIQKAVVEELAAEKVNMAEEIAEARRTIALKDGIIKATQAQKDNLEAQVSLLKAKIAELEGQVAELELKEIDTAMRNPNALALLDRDVELPDRFPGETRDHVIDAVKIAKEQADKDGRRRRSQLLEGVLLANESSGNLARKRTALEKFLEENHNVLTGTVIKELDKYGIKYKDGDKYLLISEIINNNY